MALVADARSSHLCVLCASAVHFLVRNAGWEIGQARKGPRDERPPPKK
jgi:hypothetical protein